MKLSLVVAEGVHAGKVIPVTAAEFIIGRDPQCQLRPASPAVSKQHCALSIRDGKVYVRDCGSTNGTFINDEQVAAEREVKAEDRLRVGPLEFVLRMETGAPGTKSSPVVTVPAGNAPAKAGTKSAAKPAPAAAAAGTVPLAATVMKDAPAGKPGERDRSTSTTVVDSPGTNLDDDPDHAAALLLGLEDASGANPTVEGFSSDPTTVMEMPALGDKQGQPKKEEKKPTADSSSAAAEILSKYMRRPRT
jgi:pSer/pThr/pTyr-binding forkhead associated (FHA) protein